MSTFTHLHVHTQFSLLDGAANIGELISAVKEKGMKALAITDHGNMFGVKQFYDTARKNDVKPIIGCEVYVARRGHAVKDEQVDRSGDHLIVLAKNKTGYHNLVRLISKSWRDGFYYKPRIDKKMLWQHREGLIISTACLGGEIPRVIRHDSPEKAEELILEYKEHFGDDFYLELMDHGMEKQKLVNKHLIELSKKTDVKLIATNDCHFIHEQDAPAHDILVCLSTGKDFDDPKRMRYTGQEFVKTPDEMLQLFSHVPEALENTQEIVDKVEVYSLNRDVLLPAFPVPDEFEDQDDYLRHLTYEGAKAEHRYPVMTDEIRERLDMELNIIKEMGFAGYFLIVQDFIRAARDNGVSVGPGRGSAAGSAVAFCTGITNVDPIKYKLLFERFLNPERVTMPDIDIDFDEDGREDVLDWVVQKYGKERVAHIITFGTMAAKSSIKDVARVLALPLPEANRLAKLVPEKPGTTLSKAYKAVPELESEKKSDNELIVKTLDFAETLEGSVRQTGIHACGVIIGPEDLIEHIPLSTNKETDLLVTQYDGKYVEDVGMLKMDFLGLKTLSIIKDAIENVAHSKGIHIDPDKIPLDDPKTFELYQRGETIGTFQFESSGMRRYLTELKPTTIEDLFAMNALYRPGPMDFIPSFIKRKHGKEKVEYPHPMLEDLLKDTYGIMIYQEQIMKTAQIMAGFSLGKADILRRAMGKKKMAVMAEMKTVFIEGAQEKGIPKEKAEEVFDIMAKFASYGFNRSHSAAYSIVAFQTGYLKAHYPGEYMSAVLSRNITDIKKITIFMDESRRMGIPVKGPDINESFRKFTVNKKGEIRFGLAAIKGVGDNITREIIKEREENGHFKTIYDFVERMPNLNRKTFESLALAGAFDNLSSIQRHQFFIEDEKGTQFLETLLRYGSNVQNESAAGPSLFGDAQAIEIPKPTPPDGPEWPQMMKLSRERECIGVYLSAHPLDDYKLQIDAFTNTRLADMNNLEKFNGREIRVAGIVASAEERTTKNGNPFGSMVIEDYTSTHKLVFFGKDYLNFKQYFTEGYALALKGKIQHRFGNPNNELEYKVSSVQMMSEIKDKMLKSIAIKVPIEKLTPEFLEEINSVMENNKGNADLKFLIYEPETKVWIQMFSRSVRVTISNELVEYLDKMPEIQYKID